LAKASVNNAKVSHAITGNIVDPTALGPKAIRIRICEGTAVSILVTDLGGGPTITANTAGITGISCNASCTATVASLTGIEKYTAVSADGKDTDRVTLLAGIDY